VPPLRTLNPPYDYTQHHETSTGDLAGRLHHIHHCLRLPPTTGREPVPTSARRRKIMPPFPAPRNPPPRGTYSFRFRPCRPYDVTEKGVRRWAAFSCGIRMWIPIRGGPPQGRQAVRKPRCHRRTRVRRTARPAWFWSAHVAWKQARYRGV
jgi:hypothetical protein